MKKFKNIILCIAICIINLNIANAQNAGKYYKDDEIDKYLGTWEWQNGNEKFTLIITKQKLLFDLVDENFYEDYAVCWLSYTKNGQVIESSMDKLNTKVTTIRNAHNISGLVGTMMYNKYLSFGYYDKKLDKAGVVHLTMLPGKSNEATWELAAKIGGDAKLVFVSPGDPIDERDYTLPRKMTLKKIN